MILKGVGIRRTWMGLEWRGYGVLEPGCTLGRLHLRQYRYILGITRAERHTMTSNFGGGCDDS